MSRHMPAVAFVLGILALAGPALAQQGQSAMIVGDVRDSSGGAIANATISVSSASLIGGIQTVTTARTGSYRIPALAPGTYEITASAPGLRSLARHAVTLLPGATATIDFVLEPANIEETVNVSAREPAALDVRTSAASTVIGRTVLDNLPLDRTVSNYVNLVPGVVFNPNVSAVAFGGAAGANPSMLDGANGNETDYGTPTTVPSSSWIEEVQVVTLGADAQFGEYTGAPMNAITRSGSNALAGAVDYWTTRPTWVANNRGSLTPALGARFRPLDILERWSTTTDLGGPIRTDKAWFFGGVDIYRNINRPAGFAAIGNPPEDAVATLTEPKWLAKLTAAPRSAVRLEAYAARNLSTSLGGNASPTTKPEALEADSRRELLWNGRLTWVVSDRTLVEAQQGGHNTRAISDSRDGGGLSGAPGHFDVVTGIRSVNFTNYRDLLTRPINSSIAITRYAVRPDGRSHQIRAGFEYEYDRLRERDGYPGGMVFYDRNGQPDTVTIQAPTTWRPDHHRETFYLQDGWAATNRLTVNAGVRVGFYQGAITGYPRQFSAHSIAPRLGVAWDVLPEHTLAVRGHYGRYHEAMVTGFYEFLDPLSQQTEIDARVVGPNQFEEYARYDTTNAYTIDPHVHYPYAEEWIAAVERTLPHRLSLTAQYIGRRYGSIVGHVGLMNWTPVQLQDPGPDGRLGTSDDGALMTIYYNPATDGWRTYLTNPADAYKHYNGLQLIVTRRATGIWEGQASYTWSRTRASFDNNFSSNAANNDLVTNGVYVNPNRAIFDSGPTSFDVTHELKTVGTVRLPAGFRASGVYRLQSGTLWQRRVNFPGPTQFFVIAVEPRGPRRTPAPNLLDLRIEKTFGVGRSKIGAYADVFNVMNQGIGNRFSNVSGPNFATPTAWSSPRILRAGLRVMF